MTRLIRRYPTVNQILDNRLYDEQIFQTTQKRRAEKIFLCFQRFAADMIIMVPQLSQTLERWGCPLFLFLWKSLIWLDRIEAQKWKRKGLIEMDEDESRFQQKNSGNCAHQRWMQVVIFLFRARRSRLKVKSENYLVRFADLKKSHKSSKRLTRVERFNMFNLHEVEWFPIGSVTVLYPLLERIG